MKKCELVDNDKGWNHIQQMFQAQRSREVVVGLLEQTNARSESPLPNAALANFHEFGLGVPERSFLRSTFDKNLEGYWRSLKTRAGMVLAGRITIQSTLDSLGKRVQDDIRNTIHSGVPPQLADSTVAAKGSTKQLIDSGQLVQAITFEQRSQ